MSALAEKIGTKLLVKFACGIAQAAGAKALEKGFEEFFGSDEKALEETIKNESAEVKREIADGKKEVADVKKEVADVKKEVADVKMELKEAINQIRDVKKSIDNLASQLADSILQLRSDSLKGHLTKIDSLYNSVIDIFETVVRDSEIADLEKRRMRMRDLQKSLDNRLKEVAKNVPESLEHINSFLGEEGNINNLALDNAPVAFAYTRRQKWYLTPASGKESLDSFSGSVYWLEEVDTGDYLGSVTVRAGQFTLKYVVKGRGFNIKSPVQWNWFIKPSAPGSDRFTVRQEESPGWVISVNKGTQELRMREPLPSPSAELFQVVPV
ncbi:hypothetical protein FCIRC_9339 [Fusarium circinatum]|uniref:Uncharacterized protein n=1 Tax=Fusarium circinatum TaxID=48490 RepID=A0A8H5TDK2_FUSCI|nr:hypothetical protein FCIRC_9339 [Fusarium circinatum]